MTTSPAVFEDTVDDETQTVLTDPILFGTKGTRHLRLYGGHGIDGRVSGNSETVLKLGLSHFIAEGLALDLEFDLVYTQQTGDSALGAAAKRARGPR